MNKFHYYFVATNVAHGGLLERLHLRSSSKQTCEFIAVRNIQSIYQYFESAHGQLTSFIRHIADEE